MKKILSLGVASAVLALTAVVASAATESKGVKAELASGEFATGETVVYNVVATGEGVENAQLYLEAEGLKFVSAVGANGALAQPNDDGTFLAIAATSAVADGTTLATVTYEVTAEKGEAVKFALKADPDYTDVAVDTAVVTDTAAVEGNNTDPDNSDESSNASNNGTTNPGTGIALAVVPAVIAGAAVVVAAKKRK